MRPIISIAKDNNTNRVVHISQVDNGLSCGCICLECGGRMVAANGGKIQQHHFRHYDESTCLGAPETGLHLLAKQILLEADSITIGVEENFFYSHAMAEKMLHGVIPDMRLESDDKEMWLIEIVVTNALEEKKIQIFKIVGLNCLELNLKNVARDIAYEELKKLILFDLSFRKVICRKVKESKMNEKKEKQDYWVFAVFSLIAVLLGLGWRKRRRKRA